jgi:hypothetical protein
MLASHISIQYIWLQFRIFHAAQGYTGKVQRKIFWMSFGCIGVIADLILPFWWAVAATIPILAFSWWFAYRSDWFN